MQFTGGPPIGVKNETWKRVNFHGGTKRGKKETRSEVASLLLTRGGEEGARGQLRGEPKERIVPSRKSAFNWYQLKKNEITSCTRWFLRSRKRKNLRESKSRRGDSRGG